MEYVTLNNGVRMPILGFGVFQIPDQEECYRSVLEALKVGYRLIDTAAAYGNEEAVGRALKDSGVPRSDVFVTTKLWIQDAGYEATKRAFARSLGKLQLDVLDLYLIHQPIGDVYGAWRAMEELYRAGKVRAIGVSNFQPDRLVDLMVHHTVVPAVNQIETHPFFQQREAEVFLKANGVQIESWGPFAEGKNDLFANPTLAAIARAHQRSVAQVVLRWLVQRGVVVIPKSVKPVRITENFHVFDFVLTGDEVEAIAALDGNKSLFLDHRDPSTVKRLAGAKFTY
jgi:2,5-diketo-D-gluconate reductase A